MTKTKKLDETEYSEMKKKALKELEAEQRHKDKVQKKGLFRWFK